MTYQIVGECAHITEQSATGPLVALRFKGALVSDDDPRLEHLLSTGLVAEVGRDATGGVDADGLTEFERDQQARDESGDTEFKAEADNGEPVEVPSDGSAPKDTASKAAWVKFGVSQGRNRADLEALSRDDLVKELKQR